MSQPLILASQSASRRAMLDAAGVTYAVQPAGVDETPLKDALLGQGAKPRDIADALAELKAARVSQQQSDALVIGSDSVVAIDDRLFDKPVSRDQAADHLRLFSGQEMQLVSAVVVAEGGRPVWRHVETARMRVRSLSPDFIEHYLNAEWPAIAGCVGCFRIEGPGVQLFDAIKGDHFTILGMPLLPLLGYLRLRGAVAA
jgi:septum formation protein